MVCVIVMNIEQNKSLQIGQVAEQAETTIRTVRYYLQEGLLKEIGRSPGGFYLFDNNTVDKVRYICLLRELGLPLGKIKSFIENRRNALDGASASSSLIVLLEEQLETTDKKIKEFMTLKTELIKTMRVLENCSACKSKPESSVCRTCTVFRKFDELPAPLKAVF